MKETKLQKRYRNIMDNHGAQVFMQHSMNTYHLTHEEGQRIIDSGDVKRIEWNGAGVIVLHTA